LELALFQYRRARAGSDCAAAASQFLALVSTDVEGNCCPIDTRRTTFMGRHFDVRERLLRDWMRAGRCTDERHTCADAGGLVVVRRLYRRRVDSGFVRRGGLHTPPWLSAP